METNPFSAVLNWTITAKCNFKCTYCSAEELISDNIPEEINISSIMANLEKLDKTFLISITGGEPLLTPNIVEVMKAISAHHYIGLNTNLISKKVEIIAKEIDPTKIIFVNASFHINELEKHNLFDRYLSNFLILKKLGIGICSSLVGHPMYLPKIKKYKKIFDKHGIYMMGQPFQGEYNNKKYPEAYTPDDIKKFHIVEEDYKGGERFFRKGKICSAGYNFGFINEYNDVLTCYRVYKKLGNINTGFKFNDVILKCPSEYCPCPTIEYYPHLLKYAIQERPEVYDEFKLLYNTQAGYPIFTFKDDCPAATN